MSKSLGNSLAQQYLEPLLTGDRSACRSVSDHALARGVPNDEVLKLIGDHRPDLLVMYGTLTSAVPAVRKLIDYLREVNSCPDMQVMCCGGIYKRAEGLAEEIGADLFAPDAPTAVSVAND